jgi:2Fe-2S ferredoxin
MAAKTWKVTFQPLGRTVDANEGDTLLETALAHDVPLMHACGGFCACTTCHVKVIEHPEALSQIEEEEQDRIESADGVAERSRLGCQAKVRGDVTVEIQNLDE